MAERLCTLRKRGGGALKETILWTNSAPTSTFTPQDITVADISSFKYLKFVHRKRTDISTEVSAIFEVADLQKATQSLLLLWYMGANSSTADWIRYIWVKNNTTVFISNCYSLNYTSTDNSYTIPVQIIGLK